MKKLLIVLIPVLLLLGCTSVPEKSPETTSPETKKSTATDSAQAGLTVYINYSDGSTKVIGNIPWTSGMTALDVMEKARTSAPGVSFEGGSSCFLTKIDNLEQNITEKKYWLYCVNNVYSQAGCCDYKVNDQDKLEWYYGQTPCKGDNHGK